MSKFGSAVAAPKKRKGVKKMENKILVMPLMLLLAASVVSAVGMKYNETPMLTALYKNAQCRVEFTNGVIDSIIEKVPEAAYLSSYQDMLNDDLAQLYNLAQAGDREAFKDYLKEKFEPDFHSTKEAIRDARRNFTTWGVTPADRRGMLDYYKSLNETYGRCRFDAMKEVAEERLNWMNAALERASERSRNLSARGVNTTELDAVIDGARSAVVEPLEIRMGSATTALEIREALGAYCLDNSCPNGLNYHFFAKSEIARLNGILGYIKEDAIGAGLGSDVETAQGYLDSASAKVQETGNSQYAEGVGESVWNNIRSAAESIKDIFNKLRGAGRERV